MGSTIDGRADQYGLAATAYHLLTGAPVFGSSNPAVVISQHLNSPPPSLTETRPDLAWLDPVIAKALAKRAEDRFRSCTEFADAMRQALNAKVEETRRYQDLPTSPALPVARSQQIPSRSHTAVLPASFQEADGPVEVVSAPPARRWLWAVASSRLRSSSARCSMPFGRAATGRIRRTGYRSPRHRGRLPRRRLRRLQRRRRRRRRPSPRQLLRPRWQRR